MPLSSLTAAFTAILLSGSEIVGRGISELVRLLDPLPELALPVLCEDEFNILPSEPAFRLSCADEPSEPDCWFTDTWLPESSDDVMLMA